MMRRALISMLLFITASASILAEDAVVRILFFTGEVTVTSGQSTQPARIGQQLSARDVVTVKKGATLQLAVNGKVVKYSKAAKLKFSDVVKRAGAGENAAVSNSLRTIAAASGAGRQSRTSQAGATRAHDTSRIIADAQRKGIEAAKNEANDELSRRTGIDDPLGKSARLIDALDGDALIVLEPRATAVAQGPIRFRWLRTPGIDRYALTVKNYLGEEIYTTETSDTETVWTTSSLQPEAIYTWTLRNVSNPLNRTTVSFHQLNPTDNDALRAVETEIRKEFPSGDDSGLMLLLAGLYADKGCYGEAARLFTQCASRSGQHFRTFMDLAREQYEINMFVPPEELQRICGE